MIKKVSLILVFLGFFTIPNLVYSQNLIRVNNTVGIDADYDNLQEAINDAGTNDIIYIEGSALWYGNITLTKRLKLIGPGYFLADNNETQANKIPAVLSHLYLNEGAEDCRIIGLQISGITINCSDVIIERNRLSGISLGQTDSAFNVIISQNYFDGEIKNYYYPSSGIISNNAVRFIKLNNTGSYQIYNNVVRGNSTSQGAYWNIRALNSNISNNICFNSYGNYPNIDTSLTLNNLITHNICENACLPDLGNQSFVDMSTVFLFEGSLDAQYQLLPGSPANNAGINGEDCGIFGGPDPYVLSGIPPYPHVYEVNMPPAVSGSSGIPVNIKIKSQN